MSNYVLTKSDGRICVRYIGNDGKQHEKSFGRGEEAERQAQSYCDQWNEYYRQLKAYNEEKAKQEALAQLQQQTPMEAENNVITLKMLCEEYIQQARINGRSANHINALQTVCHEIFYKQLGGETPVKEIDYGRHILPFLTWLQDTTSLHTHKVRSVVTQNRYSNFLKSIFNYAVRRGYIATNPMQLWRKQHEPKQPRALDVPDLQKIIKVAVPHLAWALDVAYNTGARTGESELLSLKWEDVDFEKGIIHIYGRKTKKDRWLPISDDFLNRLREKKAESDCEFIISYKGKQIQSLRKSFKTACKKAGITYPVRMYDVRHRYASELIKSHVPVGIVSRVIGHSRVSTTTDVYLEVLPKEMFDIKDKIPKLVSQ